MDLVGKVMTEMGVEHSIAESGLGTVFTNLRLSLNMDSFNEIRAVVPKVDDWVGNTIIGGGRTGEMLALVGPQAFARNLGGAGFTPEQGEQLLDIVFDELAVSLSEGVVAIVLAKRPVLSHV
ncbi:MAG: hypothetical protein IIB29_11250 [Chloroflexi bacterium]|nr:hypothetical protein [Chloroflexota bacterium]